MEKSFFFASINGYIAGNLCANSSLVPQTETIGLGFRFTEKAVV